MSARAGATVEDMFSKQFAWEEWRRRNRRPPPPAQMPAGWRGAGGLAATTPWVFDAVRLFGGVQTRRFDGLLRALRGKERGVRRMGQRVGEYRKPLM